MKKILSGIMAGAMVVSMFATAAFADTAAAPTAQQQYDALVAKGIFDGMADNQAHLDQNMTRAQFAKVLSKLENLPQVTSTNSYTDTNDHWAKGYIEAVTKSTPQLMEGTWTNIFSPEANVRVEELAVVLVRALKLPAVTNANVANTDDWAKGAVAAAIQAGLLNGGLDYTKAATREQLVNVSFAANAVINKPAADAVTATSVTLDQTSANVAVGTNVVLKATVKGTKAGVTDATYAAAGTEVTMVVGANSAVGNADQVLKATADANGVATGTVKSFV